MEIKKIRENKSTKIYRVICGSNYRIKDILKVINLENNKPYERRYSFDFIDGFGKEMIFKVEY